MIPRVARTPSVLVPVFALLVSCGGGSSDDGSFQELYRWLPERGCLQGPPVLLEVDDDDCDTALECLIRPEDGVAFWSACSFPTDWPRCPEPLRQQVLEAAFCE